MKEKLSAMIDGELKDDVHAHLGRLRTDPELRAAWDAYHLIGDALRGYSSPDIVQRVVSRLRQEPTVLAPRRLRLIPRRIGWYGAYAAASLAAVAVVLWTAFPEWRLEEPLAGGTAAVRAEIQPESAVVSLPASEVENYVLAHQPYSHVSAFQGVAPYVRSVSEERLRVTR